MNNKTTDIDLIQLIRNQNITRAEVFLNLQGSVFQEGLVIGIFETEIVKVMLKNIVNKADVPSILINIGVRAGNFLLQIYSEDDNKQIMVYVKDAEYYYAQMYSKEEVNTLINNI
jgi:hypothetical protein